MRTYSLSARTLPPHSWIFIKMHLKLELYEEKMLGQSVINGRQQSAEKLSWCHQQMTVDVKHFFKGTSTSGVRSSSWHKMHTYAEAYSPSPVQNRFIRLSFKSNFDLEFFHRPCNTFLGLIQSQSKCVFVETRKILLINSR